MESLLSGYCRCLDASRMVLVEDGEPDCEFSVCPHTAACELAKRIREILEEK